MNSDRPITTEDQDAFGYTPLAKQLARHLAGGLDQGSLVVGIEAPWGSGKTSFLELTKGAILAVNSSAVILDYSPWVYSSVDSLVLGFCSQVASQLAGPSKGYAQVSKALQNLAKVLKPFKLVPGAEVIIRGAETAIDSVTGVLDLAYDAKSFDISTAKKHVQAAIDSVNHPLVVFIDDIDRLGPAEIRLLFQLLKALVNFDGVTYLVAYDIEPVEKALSFDGKLNGREYLKKFIQLPVRLPRLSKMLMRNLLHRTASTLPVAVGGHISQAERDEFLQVATSELVVRCMKTPRDIVRCFNLFELRLPDIEGEVKLGDSLKFLMLEIISPESVELVRGRPELFVSVFRLHNEFLFDGSIVEEALWVKPERIQQEKAKLFESIPEQQRAEAHRLIDSLFPNEVNDSNGSETSAQSSTGLIKLLYGGGSPLAFSAKEARSFLLGGSRDAFFKEVALHGVLKEWILFLFSITRDAELSDPVGIATVLCSVEPSPAGASEAVERTIGHYLTIVLAKVRNNQEALDFVKAVVDGNLAVGHEVVLRLAEDAGLWSSGKSYPVETPLHSNARALPLGGVQVVELQRYWLAEVERKAEKNQLHLQPTFGGILYRWGQFSGDDYAAARQYILDFCGTNDALMLLRHFSLEEVHSSMLKLFSPVEMIESLERYQDESEARETAVAAMKALLRPNTEISEPLDE